MKVSLKWLKDYIDISLPAAEIANCLTMAGIEVKSTQIIGGTWEGVVVGQIISVVPHPNADRLTLPTVDLGTEQVTVVCGAPNVRAGDKVAFAHVGTELIDGYSGGRARLKAAKIRGVVSNGMVCSEKELGISDNHTGIMVLPPDAPIGMPLQEYMGDAIFNLEVTPNRPDCLSVIGIARELATITGASLHLPDDKYAEVGTPIEQQASVEIQAPDLCPRYSATLIKGVHIAESPAWMQQRLIAGGMRPLNNIVDVTNFVMLEYGQPLHSFDFDMVRGKKIIVRRAKAGERTYTLDGTERELHPDTLVIADTERTVAVAGVMGGANTEVTGGTTAILLEAANFSAASIHYTGRILGITSEACMRFERGIRPEITLPALKRATQLIKELAGGEVAQGIIDVYPGEKPPTAVSLSTVQVKRVLGVEFSRDRIMQILISLGFECSPGKEITELTATPPYWRSDIHIPEDLIEEIARIAGYDKIPTTMLSQPIPQHDPLPIVRLKREIRDYIIGYGFSEILTPSLVGINALKKISAEGIEPQTLRLTNPMTSEQEYLRPSLRVNILSVLAVNQRTIEGGIRIFEISRVFIPRQNDLPDLRDTVCGAISGPCEEKWWRGGVEPADFFMAKGVVEALLDRLKIQVTYQRGSDMTLHPVNQADIITTGRKIGVVGEIHPRVRENFEISGPAYLFELDLPDLIPEVSKVKAFKPVPRFPTVMRDLALVVNVDTTHRQVFDILTSFPLVEQVSLFDVYTGDQVPQGKKSLAYRIAFQSPIKTLTDEEVGAVLEKILEKLNKQLGAILRS
jgi:phenylalanyl-tRNA synthetase beta chain